MKYGKNIHIFQCNMALLERQGNKMLKIGGLLDDSYRVQLPARLGFLGGALGYRPVFRISGLPGAIRLR